MKIIGVLRLVVAVQAAAIAALMIWRMRRMRAEQAPRESEARFRRIIDSAPVMLWTARPDTTLDYLNGNCVEFSVEWDANRV